MNKSQDKFDVVEFSFDGQGAAKSKVIHSSLPKVKAQKLCDKLNEKPIVDDHGGGSEEIVAYGCCPVKN